MDGPLPDGDGDVMADETAADDGAVHEFWQFIAAVRARPHPPDYAFSLEDVRRFLQAVDGFENRR